MVKNPYPGGNPGGVLKNNGGPKAGKKSDQGVVGKVGSKSYAPAPDRNMGNSPNTSSDYGLDQHFGRGSNLDYSKRKPSIMRG